MKKKYNHLLPLLFLILFKFVSGQTLDATLLELQFSNDGFPEKFTKVDNGFYFSAEDDQLWFSDGTTENTYLVKDFDSGLYDDISLITPVGTKVFFVAELGNDNRELWISDGTEEGTIQLTDRNVGFSTEDIYDLIEYNGKIYFGAYSEVYGNELWVSDGTPSGTYVLKDIAVGEVNSDPNDFFIFNEKLFFKAYTEEFGIELWTSDGTEEGTVLFKDINPGVNSMPNIQGYLTYNNNFYFFADDGVNGTALWKSDGTLEGTQFFKKINPESFGSTILKGAVLNDKLIFVADDAINGRELWVTDGTPVGTSVFKDINPGTESGFWYGGLLQLVGDKIYFFASDGAEQSGLWVTDGTDQGTIFIDSVTPQVIGADGSGAFIVYFASNGNNKYVLWKSDGTPNGTMVLSEDVEVTNISVSVQGFLSYNNQIFFNGHNEVNGNELWVTNGTTAGTKLFLDVNHSYGVSPSLLKGIAGRLFFRGNQYGTFGLCTSDGTTEGTRYLTSGGIDTDSEFADFNGKLVFSASDSEHGFELWLSDGTLNGTKMIKDINMGTASSMYNSVYIDTFFDINNQLYFMANDGIHGYEFWVSDGTESGTSMVKDIRVGGSSYPSGFVLLNGTVYFYAQGDPLDSIWKTDGTEAGTSKVIELNDIRHMKMVNNKLLIIAETSGTTYGPHDLWASDGTAEGTQHLKSFGDNIDSDIQFMTTLNDELYFVAKSPESFRKAIYKSDGTVEGTILLYDGASHDPADIDIDGILTCGDYVYFAIQEGFGANKELWRTDGTVEGTLMVAGPDTVDFSYFRNFTCFDGSLFYLAEGSAKNIWVTNGQPNEAVQLNVRVTNGPDFQGYDGVGYMGASGDKLYFEASNGPSGSEIYVTKPYHMTSANPEDDLDNDGVLNILDHCPDTPNGEAVNEMGCSQSQLDDDNDGVMNDVDQCPDTPNGETVNAVGCSENQLLDDDDDGVQNYLDQCPDTPNGETVDAKGCSDSQLDDDNDGITNDIDQCPGTPNGETVDAEGCSDSQLDDDNDGITNDVDQCPDTPNGETVDTEGCPILASDNFNIEVIGETCPNKNNCKIIISANSEYNYVATINNDIQYNFTNDLTIENLTPNTYHLCISFSSGSYEQCYDVELAESSAMAGRSALESGKVSINIDSGTPPYSVLVNDILRLKTFSSSFVIEVQQGDFVEVNSDKACEGSFSKLIDLIGVPIAYPNPTSGIFEMALPIEQKEVEVELYNLQSQLISSKSYPVVNGKVQLNISDKAIGMYIGKVHLDHPIIFKILKQ